MEKPTTMPAVPPAFGSLLTRRPDALALLEGDAAHPTLKGTVRLYQTGYGVVMSAAVTGLPVSGDPCQAAIFAFHLHEGDACDKTAPQPFSGAGAHYNPGGCAHPAHAGDLPPLFGNDGVAFSAFLTNRFTVRQAVGRTLILHARPDDFMTQPGGNAGDRLACGVIRSAGG